MSPRTLWSPLWRRAPRVSGGGGRGLGGFWLRGFGLRGSGLWPWLAACLLAWLTAHALAGTARLIWSGAATLPPAQQVAIEADALPPVPSAWGASSSLAGRPIPMTDLPYTVTGQAISGDPSASLVVLATPTGQHTLMAGDPIESAISVERIDAEGVILSRQGQLERLPWPDERVSEDPITRITADPTRVELAPAAPQDSPP
jgi:hypothetical protein